MISNIISKTLLRDVRTEISENISFTSKETDIYKIDQSGDLANLDGLEDEALKRLPSLKTLRNALYSVDFRNFLSQVTNSGPLSGSKTDMAINVYTPGCHLLCHDDVIGSRRVSYILYLTDPDQPWQKEWGGALRLYPTQQIDKSDPKVKAPSPDYSVSIPPAFNQLSFFAVQPGESFHDVEEVYAPEGAIPEGDQARRVRMAISGWYHLPQEGEAGFEKNAETTENLESSLAQLQKTMRGTDLPVRTDLVYEANDASAVPNEDDAAFSEAELDFLLKYINPKYLTPDTLDTVVDIFGSECSISLDQFLSQSFSERIRKHVALQDTQLLPTTSEDIKSKTCWTVARPPHKHRFLYQYARDDADVEGDPFQDLLKNLFPTVAFQKWLEAATGQHPLSYHALARRFRRGNDYTLAQKYDRESPGLEICLSLTPSAGSANDQYQIDEVDGGQPPKETTAKNSKPGGEPDDSAAADKGGYLAYMIGDDDETADGRGEDSNNVSTQPSTDTSTSQSTNTTTTSFTPVAVKPTETKHDPAVYRTNTAADEDPILFHMPATWNQLGIVLRDKGTMRFVKYLSRQAKSDRWDIFGEFTIDEAETDEEEVETEVELDLNNLSDYDEEEQMSEETEASDDDDVVGSALPRAIGGPSKKVEKEKEVQNEGEENVLEEEAKQGEVEK